MPGEEVMRSGGAGECLDGRTISANVVSECWVVFMP